MRISKVVKELLRIKKEHGDIEVTCTGTTLADGHPGLTASMDGLRAARSDVFETTVENFRVNLQHPVHGKAVRLWL